MGNINFEVANANWQMHQVLNSDALNAQVNLNRKNIEGLFKGLNAIYQNANSDDVTINQDINANAIGTIVAKAFDGILNTTVSGKDININSGKELNLDAALSFNLNVGNDWNFSINNNGVSLIEVLSLGINAEEIIALNSDENVKLSVGNSASGNRYGFIDIIRDDSSEATDNNELVLKSVNKSGIATTLSLKNGVISLNGISFDESLDTKVNKYKKTVSSSDPKRSYQTHVKNSEVYSTIELLTEEYYEINNVDVLQCSAKLTVANDDIIVSAFDGNNTTSYSLIDTLTNIDSDITSINDTLPLKVNIEETVGENTSRIINQGNSVYLKTTAENGDFAQLEVKNNEITVMKQVGQSITTFNLFDSQKQLYKHVYRVIANNVQFSYGTNTRIFNFVDITIELFMNDINPLLDYDALLSKLIDTYGETQSNCFKVSGYAYDTLESQSFPLAIGIEAKKGPSDPAGSSESGYIYPIDRGYVQSSEYNKWMILYPWHQDFDHLTVSSVPIISADIFEKISIEKL